MFLGAVFVPVGDGDVFAGAGEGVGHAGAVVGAVFHFEAGVVGESHLFGGVVVAVEYEAVELSFGVNAVGEALYVVGEEFVFLVAFVPIAHLHSHEVRLIAGLVEHEAVFGVDGEGYAFGEGLALGVASPGILYGRGEFVEDIFFVVMGGGDAGPGKVVDGGLGALVVHFDDILCREAENAAGEGDG